MTTDLFVSAIRSDLCRILLNAPFVVFVEDSAQSLHESRRDVMVPATGTSAWRTQLRTGNRSLGSGMYHGGNVGQEPHNAGF